MARTRLNPAWVHNRKEEIRRNEFVSTTLSYNSAAQWLITYLDSQVAWHFRGD